MSQIFFTGINISALQGSRMTSKGTLKRVLEGVYVVAYLPAEQQEMLVNQHAIRIANMFFNSFALSHSSAFYRGPVNRELFLLGRNGVNRTSDFLNIHMTASAGEENDFTHRRTDIKDSLGEFQVLCACDELVFLQMFEEFKKYKGKRIHDRDLAELTSRVLQQSNNSESELIKKLRYVSSRMKFPAPVLTRAIAAVARYISDQDPTTSYSNLCDLRVYWNHRHVANLVNDGMSWDFAYRKDWLLPLSFSEHRRTFRLPHFIDALMPESNRGVDDKLIVDLRSIKQRIKCLSNLCIVQDPVSMESTEVDILDGRLVNWRANGVFTGSFQKAAALKADLNTLISETCVDEGFHKISGCQPKLSVNLDSNGSLSIAKDAAFTHLMKVPTNELNSCGVEWFCLEVARRSGLRVAQTALVKIPGDSPYLLSERFDIREGPNDRRLIVAEDMGSALGMLSRNKYESTMEKVAEAVLRYSTDARNDGVELFKSALMNWLMGNGDCHLKNISFIKVAKPTLDGWESVRLSPAYDILCTRVFPRLDNDPQALPLTGKREGINRDDLMEFASCCRLGPEEADEIITRVTRDLGRHCLTLVTALPEVIREDPGSLALVSKTVEFTVSRCADMFNQEPSLFVKDLVEEAVSRRPGIRAAA